MFCELGAGAAFFLREKNEAHQSRECDRFVGRPLVRDWYDDDDDDDRCARIINQSINRFQEEEEKKARRVVVVYIKSHLSPVGKTHPTDSLTTVFSAASASSQPRPRSLPPPLVGHSHPPLV